MKKRFLSILLALVIALGAAVPALAADTLANTLADLPDTYENANGDIADKVEFFSSLLTDEALAEIDAVGEGFLEVLVAFILRYFEEEALWAETLGRDFDYSLEDTFAEFAYYLNDWPQGAHDIAFELEWMGLWRPPTPFDHLAFGADIVRDDVVTVFYAVAEHFRDEGFDALAIVDQSDASTDDWIDLIYALFFAPGDMAWEMAWYLDRHGDMWLVQYIYDIFDGLYHMNSFGYDDEMIIYMHLISVYAEIYRNIGMVNFLILFSYIEDFSRLFDFEAFANAMINNPQRSHVLAQLATYSQSEFEQMMNVNWYFALEAFVQNNPPQGLVYVDMLLDGFMEENREIIATYVEDTNERWQAEQARSDEEQRVADDFDELFRLMDELFHYAFEFDTIEGYRLEQRFTRHIMSPATHLFDLSTISGRRLNIHFANRGDTPITITYFFMFGWDIFLQQHVVVLQANGRYSSQMNFAELPPEAQNVHGELIVFFTSEDDADIDVHFAYRLTNFPRGHYTHGSH